MPTWSDGSVIQHYRIVERLGEGGAGEVYRADDLKLARPVALKLLLPEAAARDPRAAGSGREAGRRLLLHEARAASAINHPHVVTIYAIEETEAHDFLVMEYVAGESLRATMDRGPLPIADVIEIGRQVAEGLGAAHAIGLVHRDVKPANILLASDGRAKVLDFGIAGPILPGAGDIARDRTGALSGTLHYMSPEQTRDEPLDGRSDLFALGVVLYEAATGILPFGGYNLPALLQDIARGEPRPPSHVRPGLPAAFDRLVARVLAKSREQRFPSAAALAAALAAVLRADSPGVAVAAAGAPAPVGASALVGRARERAEIERLVAAARAGAVPEALLISGEPGIGKSRLLDELDDCVRRAGGQVLRGRCYETEMVRPYGAWIDALRSAGVAVPAGLRPHLAPLLPELGAVPDAAPDRGRLFDAVAQLLRGLAAGGGLLAIIVDDIHWFDESSPALAHFVARALGASNVLFAFGARIAELGDNPAAQRLVRALGAERRLRTLALAPLAADEIAHLAAGVGTVDTARVFSDSAGNPLFALEIARALSEGAGTLSDTLEGLIAERLERLEPAARELLPFAAALGRAFAPDVLAAVAGLPHAALLGALEVLERRSILRVETAAGGEAGYDFVHDLVRQTAYRRLSDPRRRLLHQQIARTFAALPDPDGARADELAHHALLGGEPELAARACLAAGERCVRLFARAEARQLAQAGLAQALKLPRATRLPLQVGLLGVVIGSGEGTRGSPVIEAELVRAVAEARVDRLHTTVAKGLSLLMRLRYQGGQSESAAEASRHAAEAGRGADPLTAARVLAQAGHCLVWLERDVPGAEAMLAEAQTLAQQLGQDIAEIPLGLGLVHHHFGEHDQALVKLERALALAEAVQDHWRTCVVLGRMATIELERGRPAAALARSRMLQAVAVKLGEGSEGPQADALQALALLALDDPDAAAAIDRSLATLRAIDHNELLAYFLTFRAAHALDRGQPEVARPLADQALAAAAAGNHLSELGAARALLGRIALADGNTAAARAHLAAAAAHGAEHLLSARARTALQALARQLDGR